MTLEQLRVLQAIITEGTFHGAAARLNKSQPALSHMMKKLEETVGFKILSRENYRPSLSENGALFYRKALRVLEEANALYELSKQLGGEMEAELHLVVTATCNLSPLLSLLHQLRLDFPHTHVRLSIESMGGPVERLMEEKADLVIATMDGISPQEVKATPFQEVRIIPVCHRDYPAAQIPVNNSSARMSDFTQIVVSDSSHGAYEQSRDLLPENPKWTVSDFASKKAIILSQMGWGGLPEHLIQEELESGKLVALKLDRFPIRVSQLMLMQRRDSSLGPVGQSLWQRLKAD